MPFSMMPPFQDFGDRPGDATSAAFLARINKELSAARNFSASPPLTVRNGSDGTHIALDRGTLDLRRFRVLDAVSDGGFAQAESIGYDFATNTCTYPGERFTVYAPAYGSPSGETVMEAGEYGIAQFQPDAGHWEILNQASLNNDGFFPARLDSHTGTTPITYAWTEMEYTSEIATATVLSGGRTGTTTPASWRATELNNNSVADATIVWMRREFKATSPAAAVITKTIPGNQAGTHATFALYVDANTTTGGTYTITMDSFTTADIAFNANAATTKTAIQTATGYTLSAFSGAGTLASPWVFTVSSDTNDHTASTDTSTLKDKSGFRFDMGGGTAAGLCGWDAMPEATGEWKPVVLQEDGCLAYVTVDDCEPPVFLNGGTLP